MAQQGMVCTNCFQDTGIEPDFSSLISTKGGGAAIAELCAHWMCNDCLDQWEDEQAEIRKQGTTP